MEKARWQSFSKQQAWQPADARDRRDDVETAFSAAAQARAAAHTIAVLSMRTLSVTKRSWVTKRKSLPNTASFGPQGAALSLTRAHARATLYL